MYSPRLYPLVLQLQCVPIPLLRTFSSCWRKSLLLSHLRWPWWGTQDVVFWDQPRRAAATHPAMHRQCQHCTWWALLPLDVLPWSCAGPAQPAQSLSFQIRALFLQLDGHFFAWTQQ